MTQLVAAGRRVLPRGWSDFFRQLTIWFGFLLLYQLARGVADRNPTRAFDNGLRVIDWLDTDDDRLSNLLSRYNAGIGTGAAWRLHALGWDEERVATWLRAQALVGGEGWAANRMRFIAAPQRGALIWSYWWGEASVTPVWERVPPARQGDFLRYLYGRMHSLRTVASFD